MEPGRKVEIPSLDEVKHEKERLSSRRSGRRALKSTLYALLAVAAVAVLAATLVLPVLQVTGTSMQPTLDDGDVVVLVKGPDFAPGDLCGFYLQNKLLIKRVIAGPGDYVDIDEEGNVYVNGQALDEPYVTGKSLGECDIKLPYQVPDNRYFVLGDHRETSVDSRSSAVGCIEKEQIIGKIMLRIWPLSGLSVVR